MCCCSLVLLCSETPDVQLGSPPFPQSPQPALLMLLLLLPLNVAVYKVQRTTSGDFKQLRSSAVKVFEGAFAVLHVHCCPTTCHP